jgi:hypothetical protein
VHDDRFVDLYRLRVAVAVLFWTRLHIGELLDHVPNQLVRRLDAAVAHLGEVQHEAGGEIGSGCRALLSPAPDVDGARTIAAIDRLAAITHVDEDSAAALAALVDHALSADPNPPPHIDGYGDTQIDEAASG